MLDLEQAIRERAYYLWIADGCRDGNAAAHWLIAQREILASSLARFARVTISEDGAREAEEQGKGQGQISAQARSSGGVIAGSALRQIPGSKAESKCWMAGRPNAGRDWPG